MNKDNRFDFGSLWPRRITVLYNATTDRFESYLVPTPYGCVKIGAEDSSGQELSRYLDVRCYPAWPKWAHGLPIPSTFSYLSVMDGRVDSYYQNSPSEFGDHYKVETKFDHSGESFRYYHYSFGSNLDPLLKTLPDDVASRLRAVLSEVPAGVFARVYSPKPRGHCFYLNRHGNFSGASGLTFSYPYPPKP